MSLQRISPESAPPRALRSGLFVSVIKFASAAAPEWQDHPKVTLRYFSSLYFRSTMGFLFRSEACTRSKFAQDPSLWRIDLTKLCRKQKYHLNHSFMNATSQ